MGDFPFYERSLYSKAHFDAPFFGHIPHYIN